MASGAGSNYVLRYLLQSINAAGITAVTVNLPAAPAAYGTIGVNDSGGFAAEGRNFSKATFSIVPTGTTPVTNLSIAIYGTNSPEADQTWWNALQGPGSHSGLGTGTYRGPSAAPLPVQGFTDASGYYPGMPSQAWTLIPAPSEASGTGVVANPMTNTTPILTSAAPYVAYRAVVVSATSATGIFSVAMELIP